MIHYLSGMHELRNNIIREVLELGDEGSLKIVWSVVYAMKFTAMTAPLLDDLVAAIDEVDQIRTGESEVQLREELTSNF